MLRAGITLYGVGESVSLSVTLSTQKNLEKFLSEIDVTW